jgi:hypothetical protein
MIGAMGTVLAPSPPGVQSGLRLAGAGGVRPHESPAACAPVDPGVHR